MGWPISAVQSLRWTVKVGHLSEDLGEFWYSDEMWSGCVTHHKWAARIPHVIKRQPKNQQHEDHLTKPHIYDLSDQRLYYELLCAMTKLIHGNANNWLFVFDTREVVGDWRRPTNVFSTSWCFHRYMSIPIINWKCQYDRWASSSFKLSQFGRNVNKKHGDQQRQHGRRRTVLPWTYPNTRLGGGDIRETLSDRMAILTIIYKCNHLGTWCWASGEEGGFWLNQYLTQWQPSLTRLAFSRWIDP